MKVDLAKVGRFTYVMNSVLGWLSAFFCVVCLAYLSLLFPILLAPFMMIGLVLTLFGAEWSGVNSLLAFVIGGLISSLCFFSGIVVGRFLLRAIPPRLTGERRKGVIGYLALLTIGKVAFLLWYSFKGWGTTPSPQGMEALSNAVQAFNNSTAVRTLNWLTFFFWWLGFAIPLAIRHLYPRYFLEKPFVLFLRRFSHFSDRTVQHALLQCAPAGKPVVFLTPTRSRAGDWDPFRVGFSGLKLWRPIHSMPVILRSTDEDWKQAAQELINHAQSIILDVSEGSGSVRSEIDMITAAGRWQDVVLLAKEDKADTNEAEQIAQFTAQGATLIVYKKDWIRALPRLFFGLFATWVVIIPLFYLLPQVVRLTVSLFVTDSHDLFASPPDVFGMFGMVSGGGFRAWYGFVVHHVLYWLIYVSFFVRPALNGGATTALSKRLRLHYSLRF
jgi:hypothetical protein